MAPGMITGAVAAKSSSAKWSSMIEQAFAIILNHEICSFWGYNLSCDVQKNVYQRNKAYYCYGPASFGVYVETLK